MEGHEFGYGALKMEGHESELSCILGEFGVKWNKIQSKGLSQPSTRVCYLQNEI
jgi:hypothetical protein